MIKLVPTSRLVGVLCLTLLLGVAVPYCWTLAADWTASRSDLSELERKAQQGRPGEAVHYYLGLRLREAGRHSEAFAAFDNAVAEYPSSSRCRYGAVEALLAMGRWTEAEEMLAGWSRQKQDAGAELLWARLELEGRASPERARERLLPLVRREPRNARAQYLLGWAHASLYQPEEALACFKAAVRFDPNRAEYHRELAQALLYSGKLQEALAELQLAQARSPRDPVTLYLVGRVMAALAQTPEELREAQAALLLAETLQPESAELQCELGQTFQSARDFRSAAVRYDRCVRLDPAHVDALYRLAQCRFRLRDEATGERLMKLYDRLRTVAAADSHTFAAGKELHSPEKWAQIAALYEGDGFKPYATAALQQAKRR